MDMEKDITGVTSDDLIKVNGMAEALELNNTRESLRESDRLVQEIKDINLKNINILESMNTKLEKVDAFTDTPSLSTSINELENSMEDSIHKEYVRLYKNIQAATEKTVTEQKEKILEEFERIVNEKLSQRQSGSPKLTFLVVLTLLASLANLGVWVAYYYGYIRF